MSSSCIRDPYSVGNAGLVSILRYKDSSWEKKQYVVIDQNPHCCAENREREKRKPGFGQKTEHSDQLLPGNLPIALE